MLHQSSFESKLYHCPTCGLPKLGNRRYPRARAHARRACRRVVFCRKRHQPSAVLRVRIGLEVSTRVQRRAMHTSIRDPASGIRALHTHRGTDQQKHQALEHVSARPHARTSTWQSPEPPPPRTQRKRETSPSASPPVRRTSPTRDNGNMRAPRQDDGGTAYRVQRGESTTRAGMTRPVPGESASRQLNGHRNVPRSAPT